MLNWILVGKRSLRLRAIDGEYNDLNVWALVVVWIMDSEEVSWFDVRAYKPLLMQKTEIPCLIASCMAYISLTFLHTLKWSPLLSISVCLLQEHFKYGISVISARNRMIKIVLILKVTFCLFVFLSFCL